MSNQNAESRSPETVNSLSTDSSPVNTNSPTSGAADSTETRPYDSPDANSRRKRRSFPTVISGRVSHSMKDRAKAIARSRGISVCQLVREAVQDVVRAHKQSPDAV